MAHCSKKWYDWSQCSCETQLHVEYMSECKWTLITSCQQHHIRLDVTSARETHGCLFKKTKQCFVRSSISSYTSTDSLCQFNPFYQRTSNNSLVTCYLNENKLQTLQCQPHLIWMQMKFKHVNVSHILSECKWTSNTSCQPHLIWMKMYFKHVDVSHILSNFRWTSNISKVFMSATFMSPNSNSVIIIYTVHWKINVTPILWLLIDWAHCVLLM